ncbi:MAG: 3-dehydroquinate synthase [Acidimicrobiia bacterium]|nr:3-dehydroquinate synthase [Acidimicrobiia bacterium]
MGEFVVADATSVWIGAGADGATVMAGAAPRRVALLAQPGVPAAIAARLAATMPDPVVIEIPDGESAKTFGVVEMVCRRLATAGIERGDLLVGVGGGAATDLAGFVAAVFARGIRVHYVPTTLVGAVDAAIGGKTALNLEAKNQVGTFRHPARVVIDTAVLEALPVSLRRAGVAEALKAGLVGDPVLVELLERRRLDAPLAEVAERAIHVKAGIVERDFAETGERAHLNYGHTVGHAIEVAAGIPHGEAVAVGMVAAGRVSALVAGFGGEDRQRAIITALGLPVTAPGVEAGRVRALIAQDKKRSSGGLRMVVLAEVGRPQVVAVDDATVTAALTAVGIGG